MQEPETSVEQRYCPVCGTLYRKSEAGSPCGHVDEENNITLTELQPVPNFIVTKNVKTTRRTATERREIPKPENAPRRVLRP